MWRAAEQAKTAGHSRHSYLPGQDLSHGALDYGYTGGSWRNPLLDKLSDKRVAIVGTGATAIQEIPYLARYAKQFYAQQRTPSTLDERPNPPTDGEWVKTLKPGWQQERQRNFHHAAVEGLSPASRT